MVDDGDVQQVVCTLDRNRFPRSIKRPLSMAQKLKSVSIPIRLPTQIPAEIIGSPFDPIRPSWGVLPVASPIVDADAFEVDSSELLEL
jgi:hypothetical protein